MKKLIVHVGAHKTGTTFLQVNLRKNADDLKSKGLLYVTPSEELRGRIGRTMTGERVGSKWLAITAAKFPLKSSKYDYLLSYEGLSGLPFHRNLFYPNARHMAKLIQAVCITRGVDPRIVIYIRRQDEFAGSWYNQLVKTGVSSSWHDFTEHLQSVDLSWQNLVEPFADTFGQDKVTLRTYERLRRDPSAEVDRFLEGLHPASAGCQGVQKYNPALNAKGLALMQAANGMDLSENERRKLRRFLESEYSGRSAPAVALSSVVNARLAERNTALLNRFGERADLAWYQFDPAAKG